MTTYSRKFLAQRLLAVVQKARVLAERGHRPADLAGDLWAAKLCECAIWQSPCPNDQWLIIGAFAAAWRIDTPEARDACEHQAWMENANWTRNADRRRRLAAATPAEVAIAETYFRKIGRARKSYGYRHRETLRRLHCRA